MPGAERKYEENATALENLLLGPGGYRRLRLRSPQIAAAVEPGQFVHLRVPGLAHRVLRRPFSVCDADRDAGVLTLVYKVIGEGTRALAATPAGTEISLLGPLGRGFTRPGRGESPVLVGGGYGAAALFLLARCTAGGLEVLLGARTAADLLLAEEFREIGAAVQVATEDGSAGRKGKVTDALVEILDRPVKNLRVFACGPNPMLRAVAALALARGVPAEVSLDERMGCGVGACFACAVKVRATNSEGWDYARTCVDGPVFRAEQIVWD